MAKAPAPVILPRETTPNVFGESEQKGYDKKGDSKAQDKDMKKYEDETYDSLVRQVEVEYQLAWQHQYDKIQKNLARLRLYNNQKKDPDLIGDPLLFTVFQTVFAALYDDQLGVSFIGREEGDLEVGENLDALASFDYDLMRKDMLDYDWIWNTAFFGRGLVDLFEFDRSDRFMCPIPENIDPMTFLRDPKATSVRGDMRGRGGMRFGGREVGIPKSSMTEKKGYFDCQDVKYGEEIKSLLVKAKEERDNASGLNNMKNWGEDTLGDNAMIPVLKWNTVWKGEYVRVELANSRKKLIRYTELKNGFPIIDRALYPTAGDWDGTSIPDIVEDKQRHRSVVLNLLIQGMKSDLYPMYLYDESRVKNKGDLLNFKFNKMIGIDGEGDVRGAVQPMNKARPDMALANYVLNTLDSSAQRASATPDFQQGQVSDQKRTLGELNLVASRVDTRYSLTAKVFGWSERSFWEHWYQSYKEHFKGDIDEKMVRVVGSAGAKFRPFTRENIIAATDPDIKIESKQVSEAKNVRERMLFGSFVNTVLTDPDANKRYALRHLAKLNNMTKDQIDRLFPPTIDELQAEWENDFLSKNVLMPVNPKDNHMVHWDIHSKAAETPAKAGHLAAHKEAMRIQRAQPELFAPAVDAEGNPIDPTGQNAGATGAMPTATTEPVNPLKVTPASVESPNASAGAM